MRIALDARTIFRPQRRGTGKNLIDLYRQVARLRPDWRIMAYHRQTESVEMLLPSPQVQPRRIEMPGDRFHAWERVRLPWAALADRVQLLHCPANSAPAWLPTPTLVTIHDLIPLDLPQGRPIEQVLAYERMIRHACKNAQGIITPSQYTRDRLVGDLGADPAMITVNPWAADSATRLATPVEVESVRRRYGVIHPYVLHLGAADPRKNTRAVLKAWSQIASNLRQEWTLLVVGLDPASLSIMQTFSADLKLNRSVCLCGFAAEEDMPALLTGAQVLAYPSLSEGFGLPVLDAWACQTAILSSSTTSIPEVAGDGALLIDPSSLEDITSGLTKLMSDAQLREQLINRGLTRLPQFNWDATGRRFIGAVEKAAGLAPSYRQAA